jgi:hypothetical protein
MVPLYNYTPLSRLSRTPRGRAVFALLCAAERRRQAGHAGWSTDRVHVVTAARAYLCYAAEQSAVARRLP